MEAPGMTASLMSLTVPSTEALAVTCAAAGAHRQSSSRHAVSAPPSRPNTSFEKLRPEILMVCSFSDLTRGLDSVVEGKEGSTRRGTGAPSLTACSKSAWKNALRHGGAVVQIGRAHV